MAELDTSEADAAPQPTHVDDDLIDYDSDDMSVKNPDLQQALEPSETRTLDVGVTCSETKLAVPTASDSAETKNVVGSLSETVDLGVDTTTQEGNNSRDHTHDAQEAVRNITDAGHTATSVAGSHVSIHEIDYDHDGLAYDANGGDKSEQLSAAAQDEPLSAAESSLPTNVSEPENETECYEIDWEDDEAANDNATRDATAQDATQRVAMDVNDVDLTVGDDALGNTTEGVGPADQDTTTHESTAAQAAPESDLFPDITVVYKGEAYPMFAYTGDGFFSNVSLIDETMKTVLDAFRAELELHNDLGPHDELVFQVDKLGLEFCEARILDHSSPPETLSITTLRQILEILDILVKNEDFNSSRTLTVYLFTKPNAMKRFEFLVESATDKNKGLQQVIYYFRPPFNLSEYDGTNAMDGYDEQLDKVEGAGCDNDSHDGDEYVENPESIEDEDAAYEYDNDGHDDNHEGDGGDEVAEYHDGGIDYSTGDMTATANDNDGRADDFGSISAELDANQEDDLIDYTDGRISSNDGQGHDEHYASAGTGTVSNHNNEEELVDYSDDRTAPDYASAYTRSSDRPGSAANGDEDLIDYTDDKNSAADENGLLGYGSGGEANEGAEEGAQGPSQAGHEDGGQGAEHHDAISERDANHIEHGVDLVYSYGYTYTDADNNDVSYDADDSNPIDYSSDKYAAGIGTVANQGQVSVESVQQGVAQAEATQADATGNAANSTEKYQNSHLQVGTHHSRHSRNASDISITYSAADADGVLPVHAQSADNSVLDFGLDELADFDYAILEGMQASTGQHRTEGGIAMAGTTESSTTATLGNDDDAAMHLNQPVGQDELSEIDWTEDPGPTVCGDVADMQSNTMKRAHPHEMDAQDGNDVKRRRS
ncbi:Uncharacterized protein TCAP_05357 [Tolypocladium capitatum]|uniref:Uncharacterized protein n=1 Tax=Tolypocladium capitatum TaxID=45235 RepID=A0A2K3QAZ1_9HYPO|nr:Uncharacterized protein TCAP_05357 [Tolypocladium capitatum]